MANIGQAMQIALLNYMNQGTTDATAIKPGGRFAAICSNNPGSLNAVDGEFGTGTGYVRQTVSWLTAQNTPATAWNTGNMTFGPFTLGTLIATASGIKIYDTSATPGVGTTLWYGPLASVRYLQNGDSLIIASGALTAVLN